MFTKREVIEMMLRPISGQCPKSVFNAIMKEYLNYSAGDLVTVFTTETNLQLMPAGSGLFTIKYSQ
jgi:hypothetical protein